MSLPSLLFAPSCPCPGTPEQPSVGGFVGGHDCRQRCVCPSVSVEGAVDSRSCRFSGFRQYAFPGAPTPPLWYKRERTDGWLQESGSTVSWQSTNPDEQIDCEYINWPCGSGSITVEHCTITNATCANQITYPAGKTGVDNAYVEWGLVDGVHQITGSADGVLSPLPEPDYDVCDGVPPGPSTSGQGSDVTDGATGVLSPTLTVVTDRRVDYYYDDPAASAFDYSTSWYSGGAPVCPTPGPTQVRLGVMAGGSGNNHSYTARSLSHEWTEQEVIDGTPGTVAPSASYARWQVRADQQWYWARADYTLTVTGLIAGVTYEVRPVLEESADVAGQPLVFAPVDDVEWERFTATEDDQADGREIAGVLEPTRGLYTALRGAEIRIVAPL